MKMEVIFLEPIFKNYIWGGTNLKEKLKKNPPEEKSAESWEISTNPDGKSIIKNGRFQGMTLDQIYADTSIKDEIFGTKCKDKKDFPILIKFIDASQNLSVQVHPDDKFAKQYENSNGKSELWYILDCQEDAHIICGLEAKNKIDLKNVLEKNQLESYLKRVKIRKGDCIYIPSGTIHALLAGTLVCEIQQNSNITYRVYDWNRGNRELHIEKALKTIQPKRQGTLTHDTNLTIQKLARNEHFSIDRIKVEERYQDKTNATTFYAYNVIEGKGTIKTGDSEYQIEMGDSFLVPANMGSYEIVGKMKLLKSFL